LNFKPDFDIFCTVFDNSVRAVFQSLIVTGCPNFVFGFVKLIIGLHLGKTISTRSWSLELKLRIRDVSIEHDVLQLRYYIHLQILFICFLNKRKMSILTRDV